MGYTGEVDMQLAVHGARASVRFSSRQTPVWTPDGATADKYLGSNNNITSELNLLSAVVHLLRLGKGQGCVITGAIYPVGHSETFS